MYVHIFLWLWTMHACLGSRASFTAIIKLCSYKPLNAGLINNIAAILKVIYRFGSSFIRTLELWSFVFALCPIFLPLHQGQDNECGGNGCRNTSKAKQVSICVLAAWANYQLQEVSLSISQLAHG